MRLMPWCPNSQPIIVTFLTPRCASKREKTQFESKRFRLVFEAKTPQYFESVMLLVCVQPEISIFIQFVTVKSYVPLLTVFPALPIALYVL